MAVLKQTSPTAWPVAPKPKPSNTVPSASTSSALAFGSTQDARARAALGWVACGSAALLWASAGCFSIIEGLSLERAAGRGRFDFRRVGRNFAKGHSRAARRDQHRPQRRDESPRRAPRIDAALGQCRTQERRHRGAGEGQAHAIRRGASRPVAKADQAAAGSNRALRQSWPHRACRSRARRDRDHHGLSSQTDVGRGGAGRRGASHQGDRRDRHQGHGQGHGRPQAGLRRQTRFRQGERIGENHVVGVRPPRGGGRSSRARREDARMSRLCCLTACFAVVALASPARAQDYPSRPVKAIVAVGAGGTGDIFMRVLGEELYRRWGQPVVVENRPGGASNIGARACADAPPDGYTICIMPGEPLAYNQFLYKKLSFDPAKDFEPIVNLFFNTQALVVNAALRVKTVDELVALSKAKVGTLSYTAPSLPLALYLEKLKHERGADWVAIPFRGGGDTTNAVLSGSTPIAFLGLQNFISHLQSGTMTGLAIDGAEPSPLFPNIPTLAELGYRGNLTRVYFGLLAPAGTPKPVINKIREEVARIGNEPAFRKAQFIDRALEPILNTPEEFARFLIEDRATSGRVVKEAGLTPQ